MTKDQNWREEFDTVFYEAVVNDMGCTFGDAEMDKKIKDFIQNLLDKAREEEREKVIREIMAIHRSQYEAIQKLSTHNTSNATIINQKGE